MIKGALLGCTKPNNIVLEAALKIKKITIKIISFLAPTLVPQESSFYNDKAF